MTFLRDVRTAERSRMVAGRRASWVVGAVAGVLAGAVTVGVAELLAAVLAVIGAGGGEASPVLGVGGAFVDRTPGWLKDAAVRTFGEHDKQVLLASIGVVLALLAVAAGVLAARRLLAGAVAVVVLGAVAAAAVASRPSSALVDVVPTVVGTVLGLVTLRALLRSTGPDGGGWSRRRFLGVAGVAGAVAVMGAGSSRALRDGLGSVEDSRAAVRLPEPVERVSVPPGVELPVAGLTRWRTDPARFYRVDTALQLPRITTDAWRLRVHGLVGRELEIGYEDLLRRPLVERAITLTCVSNEVGGALVGNAIWLGYPVADLLADLDVDPSADMVLSSSDDGMTISTPLDRLRRNRDALLAVAMNGEPLPVAHGFPVRMVVPGLYGYVSATKWVTELLVTRFADDEAYWTSRGYSATAPIKASSRIDVPASFAHLRPGRNAVAGMAWAQNTGVSGVQVRVDKGPWQDARLADSAGKGTPLVSSWVQWVYEWDARPGTHTIECRLVDGDGVPQAERRTGVRPNGSTGFDSKTVMVA